MPSLRSNGQSRQSATSACQPTQKSVRPTWGNTAPATTSSPTTSPSSPSRRKGGDYVRHPIDPFMSFSSHAHRDGLISEKHQGNISAAIAERWNALSEEEKAPWIAEAERVKLEHMERYPGYTFAPGRKMSRNGANVAKPASEKTSKARTIVKAGASATRSRARRSATSTHSASQYPSTRAITTGATQTIAAPDATKPDTAFDHLRVFSDDGSQNDTLNSDLMPIMPDLADFGAHYPTLNSNNFLRDMDPIFASGDLSMPTFSSGFVQSLDQQFAKLNADKDMHLFPGSTPAHDLCEQVFSDDDDGEEWRKMSAECIDGYDL